MMKMLVIAVVIVATAAAVVVSERRAAPQLAEHPEVRYWRERLSLERKRPH